MRFGLSILERWLYEKVDNPSNKGQNMKGQHNNEGVMFSRLFKPVFLKEPYYFLIPNLCIVVGGVAMYSKACAGSTKVIAGALVIYGAVVIVLRTVNFIGDTFS